MARKRAQKAFLARLTIEMIEGFTEHEIACYIEALCRHGQSWASVPPVRPQLPWATVSGFADSASFSYALSRSWPLFPATGDLIALEKMFPSLRSAILNPNLTRAYEQ